MNTMGSRACERPPVRQVLVLRALGLGDLLAAVPALRALRRRLPDHRITLACSPKLADAVAVTRTVHQLLPTTAPGRSVPERLSWDGRPPDIAVDLHGNAPLSCLPLKALRPSALLAYSEPCGPPWHPDEHERLRWCRLLEWYGLPADPGDLAIAAPAARTSAPGAIVVHPGAEAAARRWPAERFAAVAHALHLRGHRVVITAGAGEARLAHSVAAQAGLPPGSVVGGADDIPFKQLAALIANAAAVVVGDTGLAHLASALRTPSVVLFGPVHPRLWGPPADGPHRVMWHGDPDGDGRPGDAHGRRPDERLLRITVDEVLDAVDGLPPGPVDVPRLPETDE
ncbi:glycosyltransferase family 9 protein [Streptantibioticus rubrisoli]|uniref:Glycosyltransferase family 9 protein n=1 Tax=Streptantibioticus rubrisoli TaxID=1387313 RepID=A0ABT1PMX4_9ACTN|nr:glycosyltransferase family 9 protein [Streptantibioticus rubrisoli]MCQ4046716.1 glycosyltransferase family 9 protein [Streptantibioticus rubrisoli]